uniref:Uncharacterized protein MANES_01G107300 n=1 Tax=Rhizophora mucronata TaxID=61149 RepID=A0A2P2KW23_RHIMU
MMEMDREDGRTPNQLRPLACSRNVLHRAHGSASWSQGDTKVLAAVYGPKAGTKKNENPERACFDIVWKPKTGQIGNFYILFSGQLDIFSRAEFSFSAQPEGGSLFIYVFAWNVILVQQ